MEHLALTRADIKEIYLADKRPWVIGFSGGKDSTAVARLVFEALIEIPSSERHKPVFVVSSDTLVETPLVVNLIRDALEKMRAAAEVQGLPIEVAHPVTPKMEETFWVSTLR